MISDLELAARVAGTNDQAACQKLVERQQGAIRGFLPRLMRLVSIEERTCLALSYATGLRHPEIVAITGLPLGTVKTHISRGRQKLQQSLADNDHSFQTAGMDPASEARHA